MKGWPSEWPDSAGGRDVPLKYGWIIVGYHGNITTTIIIWRSILKVVAQFETSFLMVKASFKKAIPSFQNLICLVVWLPFFIFSQKYWVSHHPNWLSYFSEGWPNHQPDNNNHHMKKHGKNSNYILTTVSWGCWYSHDDHFFVVIVIRRIATIWWFLMIIWWSFGD